jgi:hypothetical protein
MSNLIHLAILLVQIERITDPSTRGLEIVDNMNKLATYLDEE